VSEPSRARNNKLEKGKASAQRRRDRIRNGGSGRDFFCKGEGCIHSTENKGDLRWHELKCKKVRETEEGAGRIVSHSTQMLILC
jgi:hypothetical protein